jgi:8-oxo-dGTP diphosphatase
MSRPNLEVVAGILWRQTNRSHSKSEVQQGGKERTTQTYLPGRRGVNEEANTVARLSWDGIELLFTERPIGKVYAGYLEFPGGKCEPDETHEQALHRELFEELGIQVAQCQPWKSTQFDYPHAFVNLHFFWVNDWEGEVQSLERQSFAWVPLDKPFSDRVLPATLPLENALRQDLKQHAHQLTKKISFTSL